MMTHIRFFTCVLLFFLTVAYAYTQNVNAEYVCALSTQISESSALCAIDGKLYTLNDSGGASEIYEVDTISGEVLRAIFVENAINVDWEAMAVNATHLFIGDFGNNQGSRTNLSIYKILIDDFLSSDTVSANQIHFAYAEQTDFSNQTFQTNFDAEAMVATDDSVYVFTKNWSNGFANSYAIPVNEGNYVVSSSSQANVVSLVTDAYLNSNNQTLSLLSYNFTQVFLKIYDVADGINLNNLLESYELNVVSSIQAEGLCMLGESYWLSAEQFSSFDACLYLINDFQSQNIHEFTNDNDYKVYPNPSLGAVKFDNCSADLIRIYDLKGSCYMSFDPNKCSEVFLPKGFYIVNYHNIKSKTSTSDRLVVL